MGGSFLNARGQMASVDLLEMHSSQGRRTRKRNYPHAEWGQAQANNIDFAQTPQTGGRRPKGSRAPTTIFDPDHQPIITPCPSPPNTSSTEVPQWLWNYKQNKADTLSKAEASNTIFRYDHVIQDLGLATPPEI
eukprot:1111775-Pelagomonas_calceolata.AAC.1